MPIGAPPEQAPARREVPNATLAPDDALVPPLPPKPTDPHLI